MKVSTYKGQASSGVHTVITINEWELLTKNDANAIVARAHELAAEKLSELLIQGLTLAIAAQPEAKGE